MSEKAMGISYSYGNVLDGLGCNDEFIFLEQYRSILRKVSSCHPVYRGELGDAKNILKEYFDDKVRSQSPLNCLLLGPPGAGKTFIAEEIGKAHDKDQVVEEINLSLDNDAQAILSKIGVAKKRPRVVFLDEFDVTVDGSSVVRYLLDPITKKEHAKTVFIFSGSYLKNRDILNTLCRNTADFDLLRFLFDVFMAQKDRGAADFVGELHQMSGLYRETKQAVSPNSDLLNYLRQLHKIRDFLSRINGFIIQIPDISSPMSITDPMLILKKDQHSFKESEVILWKGRVFPQDIKEFIEKCSSNNNASFRIYSSPIEPIIEYKNMILLERLGLAMTLLPKPELKNEEKGKKVPDPPRFISRKLLNYLVMAPLAHNVRSLKFMIEHCLELKSVGESAVDVMGRKCLSAHWQQFQFRQDLKILYEMHVNKEPFFESPTALWTVLGAAGCHDVFKGSGDKLIRILYDEEWTDEMKKRNEIAKNKNKDNKEGI